MTTPIAEMSAADSGPVTAAALVVEVVGAAAPELELELEEPVEVMCVGSSPPVALGAADCPAHSACSNASAALKSEVVQLAVRHAPEAVWKAVEEQRQAMSVIEAQLPAGRDCVMQPRTHGSSAVVGSAPPAVLCAKATAMVVRSARVDVAFIFYGTKGKSE